MLIFDCILYSTGSANLSLKTDWYSILSSHLLFVRSGDVTVFTQVKGFCDPESNIYVAHDTSEELVTRTPSIDWDIHLPAINDGHQGIDSQENGLLGPLRPRDYRS